MPVLLHHLDTGAGGCGACGGGGDLAGGCGRATAIWCRACCTTSAGGRGGGGGAGGHRRLGLRNEGMGSGAPTHTITDASLFVLRANQLGLIAADEPRKTVQTVPVEDH